MLTSTWTPYRTHFLHKPISKPGTNSHLGCAHCVGTTTAQWCTYSIAASTPCGREDTIGGTILSLREILHQVITDTIRATTPTKDSDKENSKCIAFKSTEGTHYDNITWMGTKKQETIQNCNDWKVVWDEDKQPMDFPPEIVTTSCRPDITIYLFAFNEGRSGNRTHCSGRREHGTSKPKKEMQIWGPHKRRTRSRMAAHTLSGWSGS